MPPPASCRWGASFCTTTRRRKNRPLWACPRGTPVCPRIGEAPVCKPGLPPGQARMGSSSKWRARRSAETGFHRDKPGWGASPAILCCLACTPFLNLTPHETLLLVFSRHSFCPVMPPKPKTLRVFWGKPGLPPREPTKKPEAP